MPIEHGSGLANDAGFRDVETGSRFAAVGKSHDIANGIIRCFIVVKSGSKVSLLVLKTKKHNLTQRPWQLVLGHPSQTAAGIGCHVQFVKEQEAAAGTVLQGLESYRVFA